MDDKGRIAIPASHRASMVAAHSVPDQPIQLFVTRNPEPEAPCLAIYTPQDWASVIDQLGSLPNTRGARKLRLRVVGSAKPVSLDKQGRILVPPDLRESAGLESDVSVVGQINKLQLWSRANYDYAMSPESAEEVDLDAVLATVSL